VNPSDVPDHATNEIARGSERGIDATKKIPGEPRKLSGLAAAHQGGVAAMKAKVGKLFNS
jgi:hypothetical protein